MTIFVELDDADIERLVRCKERTRLSKTGRSFDSWTFKAMVHEAILEFELKYRKQGGE